MTLYCYHCGDEDPPYRVVEYMRDCESCGGKGSVMQVTELLDIINDLHMKGLLEHLSDFVDEGYDIPELDFDSAEAVTLAEADAMSVYLEEEYGD